MFDPNLPPELPRNALPTPPNGRERRANARAPVNQMCEIDFPGLPFTFKGLIVDLSAGGMRLKIPKISRDHLAEPFYVQWSLADTIIRAPVIHLYHYNANEIAVRIIPTGDTLTSEITRFVYIILRSRAKAGKLYDLPAPADRQTPVARRERKLDLMRSQQLSLSDAVVEAKNRHHSAGHRWINRRIATHLDTD
ncbi:MAG TPA: PilZ domain-containing protein [Stenomitos sp.]